jgi:hypothetical protein
MYLFPCPHCGVSIQTPEGAPGKRGKCPSCHNRVYLVGTDDVDLRDEFPFIQWVPCKDDRTSQAHLRLAEAGLLGKGYFLVDDPAIQGWWAARRRGARPCRCGIILVDQLEASVMQIPRKHVPLLDFDPWSPEDDCELFGWGSEQSGYEDANYAYHPGNPELKAANSRAST